MNAPTLWRLPVQVAFVTPFLPWPADTGGKLRSFYLATGLAESATVDLFTFSHSVAQTAASDRLQAPLRQGSPLAETWTI